MKLALSCSAWSLVACLAFAAPPATAARPALPPLQGQVIVKFKADASALRQHALAARAEGAAVRSALSGRASALGARVGQALEAGAAVGPRLQVVRANGVSAAALAAQLAADPEVEYAVPDEKVRKAAAPNDPFYLAGPAVSGGSGGPVSGQWYLRAPTSTVRSSIDIEAAWARTTGSSNIVVAVLDTGVRFEHPDLGRVASGGKLLPGYDFVAATDVANDGDGRDADPSDPGDYTTAAENSDLNGTFYQCDPSGTGRAVATPSSWHGTSTASLVGATTGNGIGMAGAAPGVRILPVRVLGKCFGNRSDILAAMRWAAGIHVDGVPDNPSPAKVLNMSLGGGTCNAAYQDAVNEVIATGATIVASAGNSDGGPVEAPSTCTGVIGVVALRHVGTKVGFSSIGPEAVIAAPGGNCVTTSSGSACQYPILSASNTGSQGPVSSTWSDSFNTTLGTSFASPLVAGVVALMVSQQPALTAAQVRSAITNTARPFPTTGGSANIPQCVAPSTTTVQDECYCTTGTCGAGMLDAGAAVAAVGVAVPTARITVTPAVATVGSLVTLSASDSTPVGNTPITSYEWSLTDGGGSVSGFSSSTNTVTATLTPTAVGNITVTLAVTDAADRTGLASTVIAVVGRAQTITFTSPGNQTLGTAPPALTATASSGLVVAISSSTPTVCTVNGSTLTLVAAGTCTLTANQAGNTTYAAAPAVNHTFTVAAVVTVNGGGGGGGGALSWPWLALLALAVAGLFRTPRRA